MPDNTEPIGTRLRRARIARGFSRPGLAARSGVSARTIESIEQGKRCGNALTLITLAEHLDITMADLTDRHSRIEHPADDGGMLAVRNALQSLDVLPGMGTPGDWEAPAPEALGLRVAHAWGLYWAGRLGALAEDNPALIRDGHAAGREHGEPGAALLAQAFQLAACLCVHVGSDDLAFSAARSAMRAAVRAGDPLQQAVMAGTASWIFLHQGRPAEAEHAARTAAERIEPSLVSAPLPHLTVYGSVLLSAAAAAANAGRADATREYLAAARAAAIRFTGGDRYDYECNFGPTQLNMQVCYTSTVLEQPDAALAAVPGVNRADLRRISWGAHKLDVAQACLQWHRPRYSQAVAALAEAHEISPEWFRHQGHAREMTVKLHDRRIWLPPPLQTLARTIQALRASAGFFPSLLLLSLPLRAGVTTYGEMTLP
jgi:transcriptional regulator with XRE-family HTH domain